MTISRLTRSRATGNIPNDLRGDSIYNYYQSARMEEAARLLAHRSVSEAGYEVGFTNLSHFTRLFERHHRLKPKRYQDTLRVRQSAYVYDAPLPHRCG